MAKIEIVTDPKRVREILNEYYGITPKKGRYGAKRGRRPDLGGICFRSAWEANIARVLNFMKGRGLIADWKYEPQRFDFPIKRGTNSYLPDFKVINKDGTHHWWEVKGHQARRGMTAIKRFRKYYPDERLTVIDEKAYRDLERQMAGLIPAWE
jgi:hypothetical protein